jgi:hypothetical protein
LRLGRSPKLQKRLHGQFLRPRPVPNHAGNHPGDALVFGAKNRLEVEGRLLGLGHGFAWSAHDRTTPLKTDL